MSTLDFESSWEIGLIPEQINTERWHKPNKKEINKVATRNSMTNAVTELSRNPALLCLWLCPASIHLSPVFWANYPGNSSLLLQRLVYKAQQGMRPCGAPPFTRNATPGTGQGLLTPMLQHNNHTFPCRHHHSSFFKETNKMSLLGVNISAKNIPQKKGPSLNPETTFLLKKACFQPKETLGLILYQCQECVNSKTLQNKS